MMMLNENMYNERYMNICMVWFGLMLETLMMWMMIMILCLYIMRWDYIGSFLNEINELES